MLSRVWDATIPLDTELAGDGDDAIRELKVDLKERLEQDHQMGGIIDPLEGDCEGYHKKLTLYPLESDPSIVTGAGIVYSKLVDGVIELFWMDDDGLVNQLTENGVIKLNTLQNDIDANGKKIINVLLDGTVYGLSKVFNPVSFTDEVVSSVVRTSDGTTTETKYLKLKVKKPSIVSIKTYHQYTHAEAGNTSSAQFYIGEIISGLNVLNILNTLYSSGNNNFTTSSLMAWSTNPLTVSKQMFLTVGEYYIKSILASTRETGTVTTLLKYNVDYTLDDSDTLSDIIEITEGW